MVDSDVVEDTGMAVLASFNDLLQSHRLPRRCLSQTFCSPQKEL